MSYSKRFRVKPGTKVKLHEIDPDFKDDYEGHEDVRDEIAAHARRLRELQELLYVERKHALLICLQAMDAGGKDGTINHVLGAMNPQGCKVISFKQPTDVERDHDFLWRIHKQVPIKGEVAVFNRSHYEDVLVPRVHKQLSRDALADRYDQINAFEDTLEDAGTHILKFFLHISKDEQLKRFKDRLDDPSKHWKISLADYSERKRWDDYIEAFEEALSRCSKKRAPWFVIPANYKWFRNLAVSRIVVEFLDDLKMQAPVPTVDLEEIRKAYEKEAEEQSSSGP
jgi:PPK2 family polyphosphate:nucleotide phosphotransferase